MSRRKGSFTVFTPEVRREVLGMLAEGRVAQEVAARLGVSRSGVYLLVGQMGGVLRREMLEVTGRRLGLDERVAIAEGLAGGRSFREIAAGLRRSASTVCREVNGHGGRGGYRPMAAHRAAWQAARRPKGCKLADPVLAARVSADLQARWSPEQIAARLKSEAAAGGSLGVVSHETIYQSIYVQGRGELRRELARCLRQGRARRRPRARMEAKRTRIGGMVLISERPAEADDRAVPGHWEGDLLVGKDNHSYIATLVERATRYVLLAKLADARAETVTAALQTLVARLPAHLWRSLTWDQGREMTDHQLFSVATGIPVYFCDPHSPWQRGSNENTNGLLRQYFPKGTDLSVHTQDHLDTVAIELNGRPRETLHWHTPAEVLTPLLVATTD